jgi:dipeptidyl-peptidase-4
MKHIFIITAVALISALQQPLFAQGTEQITNELIWDRDSEEFDSKPVASVNSMNNGTHFTKLDDVKDGKKKYKVLNKYSYANYQLVGEVANPTKIKVKGDDSDKVFFRDYSFNKDETKLLLSTEIEPIYRRSYYAHYYIYDIKTKECTPLSDQSKGKQVLAEFSPDGSKVAFVRKNNIFIRDLITGIETQVTYDGKRNEVINGSTDWVYEEEFAIAKGFYWSEKGSKIAFYKFDERKVKEFQMAFYGSLYPYQYTFKYPKAGEDNSEIAIWVYNLNTKKSVACDLGSNRDIYFPRIKWTQDDNKLCILRMNRLQNKLEYLVSDYTPDRNPAATVIPKVIYEETSDTYVEIDDNLIFLDNGKGFIRTSEKDGYNHIYLINMEGNSQQITKGEWDVVEFKGLDQKKGIIYYTSAEVSPTQQHLYSIKLNGSSKKKLSTRDGHNDAKFSKGFKYFINYQSDANTPEYVSLHLANGKEVLELEDNKALKTRMAKYALGKKEFFTFKTVDGQLLNGWMIKPANFDPAKAGGYPVFMNVYGGPGHNTVNDSWDRDFFWHQLLTQHGYIVVSVDPRGTMYRGAKFKKSTYLQLGKLETEDFIEAAKYLGSLKYVDKKRIGIQGWSYGGYMSSLCMTKGADYFKAGIAVAPVTNWRYYDNIYTERFMRKPQDNASGYDDNSPINHVQKLKGPYLLVHGSADDNVHYQNTMEMINALVAANKQFDMFIYPNRNHSIYGQNARLHLFTKMLNFIETNL